VASCCQLEEAPIFHGRTKAVGDVLDALAKQANAKTPFVLNLKGEVSIKQLKILESPESP